MKRFASLLASFLLLACLFLPSMGCATVAKVGSVFEDVGTTITDIGHVLSTGPATDLKNGTDAVGITSPTPAAPAVTTPPAPQPTTQLPPEDAPGRSGAAAEGMNEESTMDTPKVGGLVTFRDEIRRDHDALVTEVWNPGTEYVSLNVVFVDADDAKHDSYGRQIKRETSVPHQQHCPAGRNWRTPGVSPENPPTPVA